MPLEAVLLLFVSALVGWYARTLRRGLIATAVMWVGMTTVVWWVAKGEGPVHLVLFLIGATFFAVVGTTVAWLSHSYRMWRENQYRAAR